VLVIWLLGLFSSAYAGGLQTDRPSNAYGALTVPSQAFQIESGVQVDLRAVEVFSIPATLRYGLNDSVELRLDSTLVEFGGKVFAPGLGVGCKVNFLDAGDMATGLLVASSIPYQGGPPVITTAGLLDMELGPVSGWGNLGLLGTSVKGKLFLLGSYSIGASMDLQGGYRAYAEHTGSIGGGLFDGLLQLGGRWSTSNLAFDGFYQTSMTGAGSHMLGAGVSYRWGG
jgi:hypothetical protein